MDPEAALDAHFDPVAAANEYREALLQILGDQDPVEVIASLPDDAERLVREAGDRLRTRPAPGEWSVMELLGHLVDAEMVLTGRYRWILAQEEPPLMAYDQDLWVERLRHQEDDPEELLTVLRALIRSNLRLWSRIPEGERAKVGIHAERGPESYELSFRMLAGHGLLHLAQMRRTLALVDGPAAPR
jgi:DinB family protein